MKSNILFFNRKLSTGCLLCEMACSLKKRGECSREGSLVKVFKHPYLSVPIVSLSMACDCSDGEERCVEICNQEALRFVARDASTAMLTESDWLPSPLIEG